MYAADRSLHGQIAFTGCVFKDCNIDNLQPDDARGLYVMNNFFDCPPDEGRVEFEMRLAQALASRCLPLLSIHYLCAEVTQLGVPSPRNSSRRRATVHAFFDFARGFPHRS
jgi:hypothetical protein